MAIVIANVFSVKFGKVVLNYIIMDLYMFNYFGFLMYQL